MEILMSLALIYGLVGGTAVTGVVLYKNPGLGIMIIEKLIIVIATMLAMRQLILILPDIISNNYTSTFGEYIRITFFEDIGVNAKVTLSQALSDPMLSIFVIPIVGTIISIIFRKVLLFVTDAAADPGQK